MSAERQHLVIPVLQTDSPDHKLVTGVRLRVPLLNRPRRRLILGERIKEKRRNDVPCRTGHARR